MGIDNRYEQNFEVAPVGGGIKFQITSLIFFSAFLATFMLVLMIAVGIMEARTITDFVNGVSRLIFLLIAVFGACWILWGGLHYLFLPRLYSLTENEIVIKRLIRHAHIPYSEITRTTVIDSAPLWWGIGTPLDLDKPASAYVTRSERLLLIETAKRRYYLSPLEPEEMLRAIQQRLEEKRNKGGDGGFVQ